MRMPRCVAVLTLGTSLLIMLLWLLGGTKPVRAKLDRDRRPDKPEFESQSGQKDFQNWIEPSTTIRLRRNFIYIVIVKRLFV